MIERDTEKQINKSGDRYTGRNKQTEAAIGTETHRYKYKATLHMSKQEAADYYKIKA